MHSGWHTLTVISTECEEELSEELTSLLLTVAQRWTDWHTDAWRQVKRWKQSWGKTKIRRGKMETCKLDQQSLQTEKVENDACWRSDRNISPNWLCPSSVYSFTHSLTPLPSPYTYTHRPALIHSPPKKTEIGLLIALRETCLKGKQRSLMEGPLLQ